MDLLCNEGKIIGSGQEATSATDTFKVSTATVEEMKKWNKTSTHNLGEERSINNELGIPGKENQEATSRKLLLNKSFDLLEKSDKLSKFTMFMKVAKEIEDMKVQWKKKVI